MENIQAQIAAIQNALITTVNSADGSISVTVNGNAQIVDLNINRMLPVSELEFLIKKTINQCIIQVSEEMRKRLLEQQQINING